ncbi:general stress protein [Nesterenkonia sp. CF4.4]|uniref:general stress protein n=1 Tax=Nesterenkonia sp. CF4.4 TaxID=3373079 RepID=UPI003EE50047
MSMNAGTSAGGMFTGGLPKGELLGRYRSYEDAQKVVDHLTAAEDFDVKALTIVGNDLRSVEHIRTRLTYPRVALGGAAQGAMFGAFIGLILYLFSPEASIYNFAFSVVLGMAIWMIIGVIGFGMRKGKREYASSSQLVATTFDVVCEFSSAHRARQLVPGAQVMSLNAYNDPTSQSSARLVPAQPAPARPASAPAQPGPGGHGSGQQGSGEPASGHQASGQQDSGEPGSGQETTSPEAAPDRFVAGYNDLPDGRPRYGVRVPSAQTPAEAGAEGGAAEGAEHGTPGEAEGAAAHPAGQPPRDVAADPAHTPERDSPAPADGTDDPPRSS